MFWIKSGCSRVGEVVLGVGACVLDKVRVFWSVCVCSGKVAGVLDKVQVFWSGYRRSA